MQHKLKSKLGFSQLRCQACEEVSTAVLWHCRCRIQWHKCGEHIHKHLLQDISSDKSSPTMCDLPDKGTKRKLSDHGVDRPMPRLSSEREQHTQLIFCIRAAQNACKSGATSLRAPALEFVAYEQVLCCSHCPLCLSHNLTRVHHCKGSV